MNKAHHLPVLMAEVLALFEGSSLTTFFDGTLGGGGHAAAILEAHPEIERYIGCDRDPSALLLAKERLAPFGSKVVFEQASYASFPYLFERHAIEKADGFLFDVGVSSMQIDRAERGFSFQQDGPLDMRMDPEGPMTAAFIVNTYPEEKLANLLFTLGEERSSRKIARAIVERRRKKKFATTLDLAATISSTTRGRGKIHPATKSFQALRIAVNEELDQLKKAIFSALHHLAPGGKLLVISFHSLEDRIVKEAFRDNKKEFDLLTKKPIEASDAEAKRNPRARSAKLRAIQAREVL